eukprot:TRINITY_DN5837_c0_g1_i6.p1 TRINITY_DN5837_c0_g1~~TRINITY_DN5837_c0_g1_i6.p1  ORF type:complete len:318 (-),score=76.91 TRINITY_DN5837_c0_g1_i6:92-940(-)
MSTPTIPRESEFEVKKVPKSSLPQKAPSSKKRVKSHMPQPQPNSEEFMASVQGAGPGTSDEAVVSTQSTGAEEDISFNSFGTIKAEMELETNIQRLKARIETANQELFSARKRSYDDSRAAANKGTTTEQPRRTASVSQKSNIDTSSLISPFGHTNSPSRHGLERKSAAGRVDSPSSLNSFGNKDKLEDEESVVLPAYMTKKLEAVIGGGPKIDLTNKPPLEVKPRPIHLQVDLPANLPPSPGTGSDDGKINAATPPRTNNPFTTSKLPSSPFSVGNPFIGK